MRPRPLNEGWQPVGALRLACVEWPAARPAGASLILLHGLGGNALWWRELAERLPGRRLLGVDLPGHGLSPEPATSAAWDPALLGRELAALAQGEEVVWIGHSWGGKLAVAAAAAAPGSRGLVLVDAVPAPAAPLRSPERNADRLFAGEYGPWPSLTAAQAAVQNLPQYRPWTPALAEAFARGLLIGPDGGVGSRLSRAKASAALAAMFAADLAPVAASLRIPVLDLSAGEGFAMGEPNRACLPQATRLVLPGHHWLQVSSPVALGHALKDWLAREGL